MTGGWSIHNTVSQPYYGVVHTEKAIDVTDYKTLCFEYDLDNHASDERRVAHFFAGDSKTAWDSDTLGELLVARPSDGIVRLDISALSGEKYVKFGNYDNSIEGWTRLLTKNQNSMDYRRYYLGPGTYDLTGYIYTIWLEK